MNTLIDLLHLIGSLILIALMALLLYMVARTIFQPTVKIIPNDSSQVITQDEMHLFFAEN